MPHCLRTNSIAILGVLVLLSAAVAAQDTSNTAGEHNAIRVYHCNVPVRDLAGVLKEVAGESDIRIVPELINNVLIVRATEAELERFDALVEHLNRPAPRIVVALTVLELDGSVNIEDADPEELLQTLVDQNAASRIRQIRVTTIENQPAQVQTGEQRPVVSGAAFTRSGGTVNTYQQQQLGTLLTVTVRVEEGGRNVVQLAFEMSRLEESGGPTDASTDAVPPAVRTVNLTTTVSAPDGKTVLLTDFDSSDSPGNSRLIGFLTATVEQPETTTASNAVRTLEARRFFGILDKDGDGELSGEEWTSSIRIRGMFEEDGLDLSQPMSAEQFVENYVRLSKPAE